MSDKLRTRRTGCQSRRYGAAMPGENATTTLSESVAADLRRRIAQGEWANGDRLPSEHALSEHYGVSRATIRTALQDLESRGMTVTRRGVGTFVTDRKSTRLNSSHVKKSYA